MKKDGMSRKNGKLEKSVLDYAEPNRARLNGFGAPITPNGARGLIRRFWEAIKKKEHIDFKQTPAFTFGKEGLLWLLSQEKCEGIRFYLAMKTDEDCDKKPEYWHNGVTLVAVGVTDEDKVEVEIGIKDKFLVEDIKSISDDGEKVMKSARILETIPPPPPHIVADIEKFLKIK